MNEWTKDKPQIPCVFICRNKFRGKWDYELFRIEKLDCDENSYYLGLLTIDGDEYGDLEEDLLADEYMIIEKTEPTDEP